MWLHITINRSWTNIKYFPCCIARYSTLHQQAISDGSYVRISSGRCMGRPLRGMEAINVLEDSRPSNCSPLYDMAESIGMAESEEQIKKDYCTCRFTCTQRNTSSELIKPCFRYVMLCRSNCQSGPPRWIVCTMRTPAPQHWSRSAVSLRPYNRGKYHCTALLALS